MRTGSLIIYALFVFCSCSSQKFTQTDLYFGLSKPNGELISDSNWNSFVTNYVAKVYMHGFTQITSEGKWMDTTMHLMIKEPSHIIIAVIKMTKLLSTQIEELQVQYKQLFNQQAVLRVDKKVKLVSF